MEDCGVIGGVAIWIIWESFLLGGGGLFGGGDGLGFGWQETLLWPSRIYVRILNFYAQWIKNDIKCLQMTLFIILNFLSDLWNCVISER